MTTKTFLENFGYLAEAPNGIAKLRQVILQLAVTGRLTSHNFDGTSRNGAHNGSYVELPKDWKWLPLGEAAEYDAGDKVAPSKIPNDSWLLDLEDIEKDSSKLLQRTRFADRTALSTKAAFTKDDVLYGKLRPYLNKVIVADAAGYCTTEIVAIRPSKGLTSRFLAHVLRSPFFSSYVNAKTYGTKMPRLGTTDAKMAPIPLPPLPEQYRIVAKVDELMKLCDELEEQKKRKADKRTAVSKAALSELTTVTEPKLFSKSWQRISDHFNVIFDTPETVKDLRQAILQLAVTGKLVPQDPKDEPAEKLLERMTLEPQYNGKAITANKIDLNLPSTWSMAAMGQVTSKIHYGFTASANANMKAVRLLRITDIQNGKVNWDTVPGCSIEKEKVSDYKLSSRDILIARTGGTVGKSFLIESAPVTAVFASYLIRLVPFSEISEYYLRYYLDSPLYWRQLYASCLGTGQPNVNGTALRQLAVPLPPLPEQHRIVAKVDELMKLCDELETQLRHSQSSADHLFDAVVARLTR